MDTFLVCTIEFSNLVEVKISLIESETLIGLKIQIGLTCLISNKD